ncbi:MAG: polyprenyl diphosphate synthase [Spirochaetota bacterium]|nr:polyprenyl diphosphate synthase [Spirochaetota bacterium]
MKDYKRLIDPNRVAAHVAIIMDGNGRWAEKRSLPRLEGHRRGAEVIDSLMDVAVDLGLQVVTLYTFSTENWLRPKAEVDGLWEITESFIISKKEKIKQNDLRIIFSGIKNGLPASTLRIIEELIEETKNNKKMTINFCVNYGGRQEIVDSVNQWIQHRKLNESLTIDKLNKYLYTSELPDVDLMIRTGGEYRISNFLLWQLAYTEFVFLKVLWPDFKPNHLYKAIYEYQNRDRRFGGL